MSAVGPRSPNIRPPAAAARIGRPRWIDRDAEPGEWDYAAELYPPGALETEPPPTRLAWAHRLDHGHPSPSPELALETVLELWAEWRHKTPGEPWKKGRRPFTIKPEDWL